MDLITVIMPVFNTEDFVERAILSVVNQTYKHWELIIVNDGSTDSSLEKCQKYAEKYENIYVFSQPNRGVSAARNLGLEKAKGEYISFLDSDDFYDKEFLEKLYLPLKENQEFNVSFCGYIRCFKSNKREESPLLEAKGNIIKDYLLMFLKSEYPIHICSIMISRNLLEKKDLLFTVGKTNGEDIAFLIKLFLDAVCISILDRLYYYTIGRTDAATSSISGKAVVSILESYKETFEYIKANASNEKVDEILELSILLVNKDFRHWLNYSLRNKHRHKEIFLALTSYYNDNQEHIRMSKWKKRFFLKGGWIISRILRNLRIRY